MKYNGFFELSIENIHDQYVKETLTATEVAQICIKQVERFESKSLAWAIFDSEKLLEQAKMTDQRLYNHECLRQLEGIPIGVKDIFNTADFATEMGSPLWKNFTPGNDARVVFYLRKEGALIPGKTVTAEFAVHTLGKTLNPHDFTRTPGTSSSGSAVAVATGMIPASIGTQTAGSIVRPASFCGIYGCKPSFGLIPRTGMLKTTDSLDTIGFFCLHFKDLQRLFNVMRVHGPDYPLSNAALQDTQRQNKTPGHSWKIAFVPTHTWDEAHPYAQQAIQDWTEQLSSTEDILVQTKSLPDQMRNAHEIHETIYNKTLSYYFQQEFKNDTLVSPIMKDLIAAGKKTSPETYKHVLKEQEVLAHVMDHFLREFDILISLSTAGEAPLREEMEHRDPALMWTMCHLPVISAPVFTSPSGLPYGAQIVARRYDDIKLFRFCEYLRSNNLIPESSHPKIEV